MATAPIQFNKFEVYSNENDSSVDLRAGSPVIEYRESVFVPFVTVTAALVDSGTTVPEGDTADYVTFLEGLTGNGTEKVLFNIADSFGNTLDLSGNNDLRVSSINNVKQSFQSSTSLLTFVSKEAFDNLLSEHSCDNRYENQIDNVVTTILENNLASDKDIYLDFTMGPIFREWGNKKKPFEMISKLQKIAVPALPDALGNMAGYLFWMTSEGFKFKSLDKIFQKTRILKRYILNDKGDEIIPPGFTDKILVYRLARNPDALRQMAAGTWDASITTFNEIENKLERKRTINQTNATIRGGDGPVVLNSDFADKNTKGVFATQTRGTHYSAFLPIKTQVEEQTDEQSYPVQDILVQSLQNYRQKFNVSVEIKIDADFSLHAGDLVEIEIPQISTKKTKVRSAKDSGIYMIADLCHYCDQTQTYTGLNLVRDSYGVKGEEDA